MVFYMSKIFLRYEYSIFPSIFGNGTIFPNFNDFLKCGCRAAESYIELDGFSLNARLVANAMKNSPQSTHFRHDVYN